MNQSADTISLPTADELRDKLAENLKERKLLKSVLRVIERKELEQYRAHRETADA